MWPIALCLLSLTLTVILTSAARKPRIAIVLAAAGLCVALWASCGGGGYSGGGGQQHIAGTPAGTYSLTITASGGNTTQNVKVSLTVQ